MSQGIWGIALFWVVAEKSFTELRIRVDCHFVWVAKAFTRHRASKKWYHWRWHQLPLIPYDTDDCNKGGNGVQKDLKNELKGGLTEAKWSCDHCAGESQPHCLLCFGIFTMCVCFLLFLIANGHCHQKRLLVELYWWSFVALFSSFKLVLCFCNFSRFGG